MQRWLRRSNPSDQQIEHRVPDLAVGTDGPVEGVKEYPSRPAYVAYEDQLPPERLTSSP